MRDIAVNSWQNVFVDFRQMFLRLQAYKLSRRCLQIQPSDSEWQNVMLETYPNQTLQRPAIRPCRAELPTPHPWLRWINPKVNQRRRDAHTGALSRTCMRHLSSREGSEQTTGSRTLDPVDLLCLLIHNMQHTHSFERPEIGQVNLNRPCLK